MHRFHYFIISACMLFTSCNKDEVITEEVGGQPIIELDSETGIYTVKVDHELTIAPTYQNVEDALFAWTIDGTLVSSGPSLQRTWNECGDFYVKLRVDNAEGYAEEELKVEVKELTPPVISLALPSQGLKVVRNTDYTFTPDIQHSDVEGFKIEWVREGKIVSTENTYTFNEKELGVYTVDNQRFQYRWDNNERRKRRGRGNDALRCQIPDPVLPANIHGQVHFCRPPCFPASVVGVFRQSPF